MTLSRDLLAILVCPGCRGELEYDPQAQILTCPRCRLRFQILNDIPVMLLEKAQKF